MYIHTLDPTALQLGPLAIRWYGLMYLIGICIAWFLGNYRVKHQPTTAIKNGDQLTDLIIFMVLGLLVGGRVGYMLFYQTAQLLAKPWELVMLWQGGMSFHGGLVGATLGVLYYCYKYKQDFFEVADFMAPLAPPAFFFGRIGNFINGELWGKVTDMPWAVIFPTGGPSPRHPSQLYEALLEGLVLFIVLWIFTNKPRPRMAASGVFLLLYGVFRFFVEFYRLPDKQLGYMAFDWLTMGQMLSLPMVFGGLILLFFAYCKNYKVKYC